TPSDGVTDAAGTLAFRLRRFQGTTKMVTVGEIPVEGFTLDRSSGGNATCADEHGNRVDTRDVTGGVALEVARGAGVTCDFVNVAPFAPVPVEAPPRFTG